MSEAASFLQALGDRGQEPLWAKVSGTAAIGLLDGDVVDWWLVVIDHGAVEVVHAPGQADCTILLTRDLFDQLCRGEENAMAATLRGELECAGDVELLYALQRIFPGPHETPVGDAARPGGLA